NPRRAHRHDRRSPRRWHAPGTAATTAIHAFGDPATAAGPLAEERTPPPPTPLIPTALATPAGTFATTGRLMRWLPEPSATRALTATTAIAAICVAADLTVLGLLSTHLATGRQYPAPLIAVAARSEGRR